MERLKYRGCMVPLCRNTTTRTPNKLFVSVPREPKKRQKWLQLARRNDYKNISHKTSCYFCEDHFDLPNDMENFTEYKVMGSVKMIRMKSGCLPSRFPCQTNRKRGLATSAITRPVVLKRQTVQMSKTNSESKCETENKAKQDNIRILSNHELQEEYPLGDCPVRIKEELPVSFEWSPSIQCVEAGEEDTTGSSSHPYAGYQCDQCRGDIVWFRYCCVQCTNYELCGACEARGHHAQHYMLRVPPTKPHVEVQAVLENIRNILFQKGDDDKCELEVEVKVEPLEPAPEPDPLAPAGGGFQFQDQTPAQIKSIVPSVKRDDLEDTKVKLELTDDESRETSHSHLVPVVRQPAVPAKRKTRLCDVKVYSGGGGGVAVYTQSAGTDTSHDTRPAPAPTPRREPRCTEGTDARKEILLNEGMLVEQAVNKNVPNTAKRKTKAPSLRQAKVKKSYVI